MKIFYFLLLLCCSFTPLFSQNIVTMQAAIDNFADDFTSRFTNKKIAVVAFETDKHDLAVDFIDTMIGKLIENNLKKNRNIEVYERHRIEYIQRELDFSLTGKVSDETVKRIGHFIGADIVIYGSIRKGNSINEYQMTITATEAESARIILQKPYTVRLIYNSHLWTIGASLGTSFISPLVIGTIHGTVAPFRYSFLELGIDLGFLSNDPLVTNYYSILPFAHYAFFLPFEKGGWYVGAGIGYLHSEQTKSGSSGLNRSITFNVITGFNILNIINISYALRTNFADFINNKLSIGYTYRF
ncbi:MAG: penicillin-binding protein activator LpoB [Treponema sp.]|nr:penicillin-binding protein activator LpoB [Treponema sp.]